MIVIVKKYAVTHFLHSDCKKMDIHHLLFVIVFSFSYLDKKL